jgi:hypothetical protein
MLVLVNCDKIFLRDAESSQCDGAAELRAEVRSGALSHRQAHMGDHGTGVGGLSMSGGPCEIGLRIGFVLTRSFEWGSGRLTR